MRRSKNDAEKTKQLLVQAACEVFYREGVARATLEQIAREAGLTRGALYWQFNNKVDILDELFQWIMPNVDVLQTNMLVWPTECYWDNLIAHFMEFFQELQEDSSFRKFFTVMHLKCEMTESNAQVIELLRKYELIWERQVEGVISMAVSKKVLSEQTDVVLTSKLLRSHLLGIIVVFLGDVEEKGLTETNYQVAIVQLQHMLRVLKDHTILKQGTISTL